MKRPALRPTVILSVLTLAGVANYLDRYILAVVLPQIRAEFQVGDALLGLLAGPTFSFIYAVTGIPLGVLADRVGRWKVVTGSLAFFSVTSALCGLAGNFGQLLAARFATGAGEAGVTPAATALISGLYPPERRAGALSIYAASSNVGLVLAFFGGGWIAERQGWRMAFLVSAGFGLLVLLALALVPAEARRHARPGHAAVRIRTTRFHTTLGMLWAQPAFRWVACGTATASVSGYAAAAFVPSFLARSHHMNPASIGLTLALLFGTFGWVGTTLPGVLADRWGRGDVGIALKIASLGLLLGLPLQPIFYLAADLRIVIAAAAIPVLAVAAFVGPSFAAVQHLAPSAMRARAVAILLFVLNVVGLSLGPPLVGVASDLLRPQLGEDALRFALLAIVTVPILPAAFCFWQAGTGMRRHGLPAL